MFCKHYLDVSPGINRSSTYCSRTPERNERVCKSVVNMSPKMVGEFLNPKAQQSSNIEFLFEFQSLAIHRQTRTETQGPVGHRKRHLSSPELKTSCCYWIFSSPKLSIKELGTIGSISCTISFTVHRSCTDQYLLVPGFCFVLFFTGKIGVLHWNLQGHINPAFKIF